jgi:hypothetical protein
MVMIAAFDGIGGRAFQILMHWLKSIQRFPASSLFFVVHAFGV